MPQRIRYLLAAAIASGALGLTACSAAAPAAAPAQSTADTMPGMVPGSAMTAPTTASGTTSANPAPVATDTVSISNFAFSPSTITVRAGSTVVWTNMDQDAHTVTATDRSFGSQPLNTGDTFRHTFTSPGTYTYLCTIHPFMTGTVVVTP